MCTFRVLLRGSACGWSHHLQPASKSQEVALSLAGRASQREGRGAFIWIPGSASTSGALSSARVLSQGCHRRCHKVQTAKRGRGCERRDGDCGGSGPNDPLSTIPECEPGLLRPATGYGPAAGAPSGQ